MKIANCLALSGGGSRGLLQLHQAQELHRLQGKEFHSNFNIISGASTGALATALFSLGYSPSDAIEIYKEHLPKIFEKKFLRFGIFRPKYDHRYLVDIAKKLLGEAKLSDCKVSILIPAYNADKDVTKIFKSHDPKDKNYLLREVVLASASAPVYFEPIKIAGEHYKDGGLGYNNPSDIISKEARSLGYDIVNILSITTGRQAGKATRAEIKGGLTGASATVEDILREQDNTTHNNVAYDYEKFYKGKGVYIRCESIIKNSSGKIDDVSKSNINNMIEDGKLSVEVNKNLIQLFHKISTK